MNCLSHAWKYLDDPWFAAGTCLPDWLGMMERKNKFRRAKVSSFIELNEPTDKSTVLAQGILQHLADDDAFHGSIAFMETSLTVSNWVKEAVTSKNMNRPAFVGHILVELLLDATIEMSNPGTLDHYYATIAGISAQDLQDSVNHLATKPTTRVQTFLPHYLSERFLFDYLRDDRLLVRMNGILNRVALDPLPTSILPTFAISRDLVWNRRQSLLDSVSDNRARVVE
jgi:hypothetical protein